MDEKDWDFSVRHYKITDKVKSHQLTIQATSDNLPLTNNEGDI